MNNILKIRKQLASVPFLPYQYNEGLFLLSSHLILDFDFEKIILSILNLHLCSFNGDSLIQLKKLIS